jgi:hypothetical protein
MRRLVFALCALAAGFAIYAEPPPNYELSWAKRGVEFDTFAADVDACNAIALSTADAVPPYRGNPDFDELGPIIWFWRWLVQGEQVSEAMAQAYNGCMSPRGYVLNRSRSPRFPRHTVRSQRTRRTIPAARRSCASSTASPSTRARCGRGSKPTC